MPETLIKVDLTKSAYDNDMVHNRWHPDVPIVAWVKPGDDFIIETYDWTGGFIKNNDSADDVRDIDLSIVHFLSGPIGVKGAEPGDLLVVDLLDVGPLKESLWGFNGFFSKQNGGGFLTDHFPLAQKSIWDIKGLYTSSRHVPGVSWAGLIHPGLIGCLPDPKMLAAWNAREAALIATNPTRVPGLANPPFAPTAHAGQAKGDAKAAIHDILPEGPDAVVEAAGPIQAVELMISLLRRGTRWNLFGITTHEKFHLDGGWMHFLEARMDASFSTNPLAMENAIRLMARNLVNPDKVISHRFPLSQIDKAIETMGSPQRNKVIINP